LSHLDELLLLVDESLSPNVAKALKLVEYNATTVREAFGGRSGVSDPEIIGWCKIHNAVWIHADDRARKEHKKQVVATGIAFLWVYRPKGVMPAKEQLRILSYVLPDFIDKCEKNPRQLHYRASAHGQSVHPRIRLKPLAL
jgi:hypothetical protein